MGAGADDQVMVIMNFTANPIPSYVFSGWPADGYWYVNVNSDWTTLLRRLWQLRQFAGEGRRRQW